VSETGVKPRKRECKFMRKFAERCPAQMADCLKLELDIEEINEKLKELKSTKRAKKEEY